AVMIPMTRKKKRKSAPRELSQTAGSLVTLSAQRAVLPTPPHLSANAQPLVKQRLRQAEAAQRKPTYDPRLQDTHEELPAGVSQTKGTTIYSGRTVTTWGWNRNPLGATRTSNGGNGN
ncbi:hypothetical protein COCVIDRAFT_61147, partial [Bipolaris victoriae FI3]